jgi:hypothetical protein
MSTARASAMETANQRGLLNSTMAATAGEKAAIESALPIAQQDAGFFQESKLQKEQGDIQTKLQKEQGDIQKGLYETQGDISKRLAEQGFEYDKALKDIDMQWNQIDLDGRMKVEYKRMDNETKARFDETSNLISEDYMKQYIAVLADPAFSTPKDRQVAIDILNQSTAERFKIAAAIAEIELVWTPSAPVEEPEEETKKDEEQPESPGPSRGSIFGPEGGGP